MKNVLKSVAFVLIFVLLINLITIVIFPENSIKKFGVVNTYKYEILLEEDDLIDVLVLGDSLVYSSYSPMEAWDSYGITSFDCAEPAQVIQGAYKYLKIAMEKEHPKIVVMEPNVIFRDIKKRKIKNTLRTDIPRIVPISKYHDVWKKYGFDGDSVVVNANKGYNCISRTNPPKKPIGNYMKPTAKLEKIPEDNLQYLEKIIDMCNEYNAKLIFVSFPTQTSWHDAKHKAAEKIASDYGIEFLDLNLEDIGISWDSETRDMGQHLNNSGAQKVSRHLAKYLFDTGLLTDHRNDSKYISWNIAYEQYKKNLAKS